MRHVAFPFELCIPDSVFSSVSSHILDGKSSKVYTLFAVIFHHGKTAGVGHYTIDVLRNPGDEKKEEWISFDDDKFRHVDMEDVSKEWRDKQAYLLFYIEKE